MINAGFKDTYTGLKIRQFIYKLTYKYKNLRMKNALRRYKYCNDKKPERQIREEIAACKRFWGCYPLHYFRYDLYKSDKKLTKEELINYIPEFFFYNLFLSHFNGDKYSILIEDKNITEQLFRSVDINQPHTICKLVNSKIYTSDYKEKNLTETYLDLKEKQYRKIFVKPADGEGGHGIKIFHLSENNKYIDNDKEFSETFLLDISKENDYIIQAGVIQHESLAKIYPNSVNTFRIATENIRGKVRVVCATLRIGRQGNEVDNGTQNGIVLGIDINEGICKGYASTEVGEIFYKHPDTNFVFKNYKIHDWDSIKNFTVESASKLPQFTYLGWDIALTEEGPIAIETNLGFGIDHYQIVLGGLREAFKIDYPHKYWRNRREKF